MFKAAIEEIREAIPKIPRKQQKVGDYFYRHPETLGVLSLTDFAARIGTSEPTVNRFCKTLGYNGFLDFSRTMHDLRNNKISHATYLQDFAMTIIMMSAVWGAKSLKRMRPTWASCWKIILKKKYRSASP